MSARQRQIAMKAGFSGNGFAGPRQNTRDRIMLAKALRDLDRRLTEAEELADRNLAVSRERLANRA